MHGNTVGTAVTLAIGGNGSKVAYFPFCLSARRTMSCLSFNRLYVHQPGHGLLATMNYTRGGEGQKKQFVYLKSTSNPGPFDKFHFS